MSEETRGNLALFWSVVDEILNSLLFLLIDFEMLRVARLGSSTLLLMALAIPLGLVVCAASIVGTALWLHARNPNRWPAIAVLTWGGTRGGVSVAVALSTGSSEWKSELLAICYAVVVFSIVQGLTLTRVVGGADAFQGPRSVKPWPMAVSVELSPSQVIAGTPSSCRRANSNLLFGLSLDCETTTKDDSGIDGGAEFGRGAGRFRAGDRRVCSRCGDRRTCVRRIRGGSAWFLRRLWAVRRCRVRAGFDGGWHYDGFAPATGTRGRLRLWASPLWIPSGVPSCHAYYRRPWGHRRWHHHW